MAQKPAPVFKLTSLTSLQLFQLIRYGTFVLIGICFARLHLPANDIGHFETFLLISGMVSFFWVSGLINTMLSVYPKKDDSGKKAVLFNTFFSLVVLSLVAAGTLLLFSDNLLSFLDKQGEGQLIRLSVFYLLLSNPSFIVEYILFLNNRRKGVVVYGAISSILSLCVAVLPVALGYPVQYAMYGLIAVAAVRLLYAVYLLSTYASFSFDFSLQVTSLRLAMPVILSLFVSGSAEYIDGLIVKSKFDDMFFAVYRYGAKELPVLLIVANTFSTAMIPVIAADVDKGLVELKRKSAKLMHIFFPLTIVLVIISPVLYRYVFNESFVYSAVIFNIYLLLAIPRVLFPQTVLTGLQHTRYLLVSSVLEILINVSLSIYLAGKFGLPGIAAGTFVAYLFDKLFLIAVAHWVYGIKPGRYINVASFLGYSLLTFVAFGLGFYLFSHQFWGF